MKFRNVGPCAVDLPTLGLFAVNVGDEIEATGDAAASLAESPDWSRTDKPKTKADKATDAGEPASTKES
jgi:hypothetical protein